MSDIPEERKEKKGWWQRRTTATKILIGIFVVFLIIIIAAVALGMWFVMSITALNVTDIKPVSQSMDTFEVTGTTEPGANLTINNQSVTTDSAGKFSYQLTNVELGGKNITIVSKGKGKLLRTLILELNVSLDNDFYSSNVQFINQTFF